MSKRTAQLFACVAVLAIAGAAQAECVTTGTAYYQRTVCTNTQTNIIGSGSSVDLGSVDPVLAPKPQSSLLNQTVGGYNLSNLYKWLK